MAIETKPRRKKLPTSASWKKGQSGNPAGAPKKAWRWAEVIRTVAERMDTNGKEYMIIAAEALLKEAFKGNVAAIKELGDRLDGKSRQAVEVRHADREPIDLYASAGYRAAVAILKKRNITLK